MPDGSRQPAGPATPRHRAARPTASVSLDLDNLWSYLKTHGDPGWTSRPTYLPRFVPIVLELLEELGLGITFFVVGADAARDENAAALRAIVAGGHEVGNHSHEHEPWLQRYDREALEAEVARAEDAIAVATGQRPRGFRGPGYSWSPDLLDVLARRGYRFDASTLPTFLGPLARMYYFATARLTPGEREERKSLFGSWKAGLWPNSPYEWDLGDGRRLLEIPVTVFPAVRTPFHLSYLLYLSRYSEALAFAYWRTALATCRLTGVEPSILLHPLDLVGADVAPELAFFPGMDVPAGVKQRVVRRALGMLRERFEVVPMSVHAERILAAGRLRSRTAGSGAPRPSLSEG
jgi:peptidoglycan/xylan/chitin deacetylase (PgdA/CDA1 family)